MPDFAVSCGSWDDLMQGSMGARLPKGLLERFSGKTELPKRRVGFLQGLRQHPCYCIRYSNASSASKMRFLCLSGS